MLLDITSAGVPLVIGVRCGSIGVGWLGGAAEADEALHGAIPVDAPLRLGHISEALAGGGETRGGKHGGRDGARGNEGGNAAGALGPDDEGGGVARRGGLVVLVLGKEILAVLVGVGVGVAAAAAVLEPAASLGAVLHLEIAEGRWLVGGSRILALPAAVGIGRGEEGLRLRVGGGGVVLGGWLQGGGRRRPPDWEHHLAGIHGLALFFRLLLLLVFEVKAGCWDQGNQSPCWLYYFPARLGLSQKEKKTKQKGGEICWRLDRIER